MLHERLHVYALGNESYVLEPVAPIPGPALAIHRLSADLALQDAHVFGPSLAGARPTVAYGVLGMISLTQSEYLILITGREVAGQIAGHIIYKATSFEVLPLQASQLADPQQPAEAYLLALLYSQLKNSMLWFSYTWDITRRLQAQYVARSSDVGKPLWETCDDRFFWNRHLQSRFIEHSTNFPKQSLEPFILPVLYGTVDIRTESVNSHSFQLVLISRRSRFRAGTRYFRRGVDHEGHVANFNETEQILVVNPVKESATEGKQSHPSFLSFVQTRGSVPVYWAEISNLRYKPDIQVMELNDTTAAIRSHFHEQLSLYGPQVVTCLLNQHGRERAIKEGFERHLTDISHPKIRYEYFDFHRECSKMRWERIGNLIVQLNDEIEQQGYFMEDADPSRPVKYQIGVVRTNCLDNLDRTNVFQSALARWILTKQLRDLEVIGPTESLDEHEALMSDFRNMWADHANAISISYSGTGALKTDFTRTGKRTRAGLLQDGYHSVVRYIKNNFFDGPRQDGFDLITGGWVAKRGKYTSLGLIVDSRPLVIRSVPYVLYFALFMICAGLTLPRSSDLSLTYYFLFWLIVGLVATAYIFIFGVEYVNWPRLIPLTDAIEYDGPGIKTSPRGRGLGHPSKAHPTPGMKGDFVQMQRLNGSTNEVEKHHID